MTKWLRFLLSGQAGSGDRLLSHETLQRMMTPHVRMGAGTFEEIGDSYYGLGLTCEQYRGERTVSHTGSQPGWGSMMSLLPDHGIGVVVLTNRDASPVRELLIYEIFDRLRGREPVDWIGRFKAGRAKGLASELEQDRRRAEATSSVAPARPLASCAGTYVHPAYGEMQIAEEAGSLTWSWRGLRGTVLHFEGEDYELREGPVPRYPDPLRIKFDVDNDGTVVGLSSALEHAVSDIRFARRNG
jgi:hypothetical protein